MLSPTFPEIHLPHLADTPIPPMLRVRLTHPKGGPIADIAGAVDEALEANGLGHSDVRGLAPHRANLRIIDARGRKLGLPPERGVVTVDRHANTSAASIPLALAEAVGDGRIRPGDLVLMEAIGGGLTWGAALARF